MLAGFLRVSFGAAYLAEKQKVFALETQRPDLLRQFLSPIYMLARAPQIAHFEKGVVDDSLAQQFGAQMINLMSRRDGFKPEFDRLRKVV